MGYRKIDKWVVSESVLRLRTLCKRLVRGGFLKVEPDLAVLYLRVVDVDECLLSLEVLDEGDSSRLPGITGVGFECESEYGNALRAKHEYKDDAGVGS